MSTTLRRHPVLGALLGSVLAVTTLYVSNAWRAAAVGPTGGETAFVAVSPTRVLDTRSNLGLSGPFVSMTARDLTVTGNIPTANGVQTVVPAGASGVVLNLTAVRSNATGYVSVRPADASGSPTTSNLNIAVAGQVVANSVTVKVPTTGGDTGKLEFTFNAHNVAAKTTDLVVDIVGYYAAHHHDERYLESAEPIVISQSGLEWIAYADGPTGIDRRVTRTFFNADGYMVMPLTSPATVGGTSYRLVTVSYCIYSIAMGSVVDRIEVWADPPAISLVADNTDRTAAGCITLTVPATSGVQPAYSLYLLTSGGGAVGLGTVTTTWLPGGIITMGTPETPAATVPAGGPNEP